MMGVNIKDNIFKEKSKVKELTIGQMVVLKVAGTLIR